MRILALIILLICCSIFIYSREYRDQAEIQQVSPGFASPTPASASNSIYASNTTPKDGTTSTADPRLTERQRQWPIEREKLVKATYPLTKESSLDVDGDGKPDKLFYRIQPWEDDFEGQVKITAADRRVIWDHDFFMGKNDLAKFLAEVLDYPSVTQWVQSVFDPKAPYSFKASQEKLEADELDEAQIDHTAELHKTTSKKLRDEILAQPKNHIFSYRAEWREDLMLVVYVPSLKQFICYSRGY